MSLPTSPYNILNPAERADILSRLTYHYGYLRASDILSGSDEYANRDHWLWRHLCRGRTHEHSR